MNLEEQKKLALSKLTEEDKKILGLIKTPKVKKNHKLKIYYMIGDANGNTSEESVISLDNPFLKIITDALDKLGSIPGHWGIMLDEEHFDGNKQIGNINELEYDLLRLVSEYYDEDATYNFLEKHKFEKTEKNIDYLQEFNDLFISETDYSFLVYEGYKLK